MTRSLLTAAALALALTAAAQPARAGEPAICAPFVDELDSLEHERWIIADGWTNGSIFDAGWAKRNVAVRDGRVSLSLDDRPSSGRAFSAAEIQSRGFAGYGRFEVRMKAVRGRGMVSSFFVYTGPYFGDPMDEIDIEFLGRDTTVMHTNYFTAGKGLHGSYIPLGFDAADGFNDYAVEWRRDSIRWFVNGRMVHEERGERGPLPSHPGKIIINIWNNRGAEDWLGRFEYPGTPLTAVYDRIAYTPFPDNQLCGGDKR